MGPTAVGKTALALDLVRRLPCDIISVDSGQVYRGMDIGTAKPGQEVLRAAPHRLIDIRDPGERYSAAGFREDAPVFAPSKNEHATHGNLCSHRRMKAIFFAAGGNLQPRWLGTVRGVDVAPTVAALLGLRPPADAQGRNVLASRP